MLPKIIFIRIILGNEQSVPSFFIIVICDIAIVLINVKMFETSFLSCSIPLCYLYDHVLLYIVTSQLQIILRASRLCVCPSVRPFVDTYIHAHNDISTLAHIHPHTHVFDLRLLTFIAVQSVSRRFISCVALTNAICTSGVWHSAGGV